MARITITDAARVTGVSRVTLYRCLSRKPESFEILDICSHYDHS
jgi:DNA-binding phage protein